MYNYTYKIDKNTKLRKESIPMSKEKVILRTLVVLILQLPLLGL